MSMFTLVISCLTTSNLPWFMDLTFQVPMQYCSLQHRTLLLSPVPFTTGCCFCFGSIPSFLLEVFLHWSPVAYWAPTSLGSSSFSILSFCLLNTVHGVLKARILKWFAIPSPVDHILSDLSTMTCLGWPHRTWLSFIELDKAVVRVIRLASCLWLWFQCVSLWYPLSVPTISLGFLLPWTWGISSCCSSKAQLLLLTLDVGQLLSATAPDLGLLTFAVGNSAISVTLHWSVLWGTSSSCSQ